MTIHSILNILINPIVGLKNYLTLIDKKNILNRPRLFLDMTEIYFKDSQTGVQRVTKNIAKSLHENIKNYDIIEVFAKKYGGGFYQCVNKKNIKVKKGDIFFGLDLSIFLIPSNNRFLKKMKKNHIGVWFYIHDMIPINFPETVDVGIKKTYPRWLRTIINYNGIIGNSQSTINDLKLWIKENYPQQLDSLKVDYSYLGYNFSSFSECKGNKTPDKLKFLMVSTVEPRKRYDLVVNAFNCLWAEGIDAQLIIVGKPGWNNEKVFNQIRTSKYYEKQLFWLDSGISDSQLTELYEKTSALIFCSEAEGFGLPIIEAASHNLPLILRDIPIFREIAGNNAFYISDPNNEELFATKIKEWIYLYKNNMIPQAPSIKNHSWNDSTKKICKIIGIE